MVSGRKYVLKRLKVRTNHIAPISKATQAFSLVFYPYCRTSEEGRVPYGKYFHANEEPYWYGDVGMTFCQRSDARGDRSKTEAAGFPLVTAPQAIDCLYCPPLLYYNRDRRYGGE